MQMDGVNWMDIILSIIYMKVFILCLLVTLAMCDSWAVLVAGSNTYSNYRHQSDVFHSYQQLKNNGFPADRIITFAYDDIAESISNPFKGKVFNKPTYNNPGVDVYDGIKIDYSKAQVTPANFLAVLEGDKVALKGKGSERVLESTESDNVFIYFADHGAPGLVAFPTQRLYAKDLIATFAKMYQKKNYKKIVFYLEACEGGSMFQSLPNNTNIYALSASNPTESSWGCYCSPDDVVNGQHIKSCLGDLFSVNYLEDTDKGDLDQSLDHQFETIKKLTTRSHVLQWGDMSFKDERIGDFLSGKSGKSNNNHMKFIRPIRRIGTKKASESVMNSRTMKLQSLSAIYAIEHSAETMTKMVEEITSMAKYESIFRKFTEKIRVSGQYDAKKINFECLKTSVDHFEAKCEIFSDFGLGFIKYFAHACETVQTEVILDAIKC